MTEGQVTPPPCVIVLGMHRSGTSLVAGSLEAAGLHLGDVNHAATYNRKGNKENESIRDLNDRLLARSRATWNAPPVGQVERSPEGEACARTLVEPYLETGRPWGLKDPRSIWTAEGWLRIVPNARPVGVFRHPPLVVRSLGARRGSLYVGTDDALKLWCAYNRELIRLHEMHGFPVLHFDSANVSSNGFRAGLSGFAGSLGLAGRTDGFFNGALVHQTGTEPLSSPAAAAIYSRLRTICARPDTWPC